MTVNFNSADNKIESITLKLSAIEFMIFHEAISKYAEERENKLDREVAKRMLNVIPELKGENNQKPIKRTKYIDGDLLFSKISGHSNYHGDSILSAISCLQEGKEIKQISAIGDNE